ncbi:MAG: ABC transporter permease subunit, partial [Rhodococcus sp. (in: high G+C Gram-positive bacteria)]
MKTDLPSAPTTAELATLRRPSWQTGVGVLAAAAIILWSAQATEFSVAALLDGIPNITDFIGRMFPPDLSILPTAVSLMGETLAIAVVGTAIGVALALPWALLGARSVFDQAWLHHAARTSINVTRAIPELMWALLFVSAVGLGPLAGTLAIVVGSAAGMARLFADIFETMDMRAWEAAAAAGATRSQRISWVLLPQSVPTVASYTLLVLDGNVRAASLLGIVGAG